nr:DUF397 domain-containing protein [Streptomyces sp. NBC_00998]
MTINRAVELDLTWTKSSYSSDAGQCIETAAGQLSGVVPVRDSKVSAGPVLVFSDTSWGVFVDDVKGSQL